MKIKKITTLISILLIIALGLIIPEKMKAAKSPVTYPIEAQWSDSFVESMGISTKFGFCPGRLCDNYPEVKALLAELGIRYIRDIPYPEPWRRRTDLYEDYGIRMLAETGHIGGNLVDSEKISAQLNAIKSWGKMIAGIVGVNEYDLPGFYSCEKIENCDPNWSETSWSRNYRQFQQRLYEQVKADPELRHLPVVLGPMARLDNLEQVGDLSGSCDKGNDHSYPGALGKPSQESGGGTKDSVRSMDEVVAKVQKVCPGKKLWITETGYEEKVDGQHNKYLVTRKAKAKYLPRIYANYYLQGQIEKTFLYVLLSAVTTRPTEFGIIDTNLQPTPAYYGIKNMTSLLGEASWNQQTQAWQYPDFEPSSLKYTLEGDNTDIKHLLLQKSDGTFYLLLWQEVYAYDDQQGRDIVNPDRPIELKLDGEVIEKANKYLLYNESNPSAELAPLDTWTDVTSLSLSVPDHILVLEFSLKD
jgi:hypothetical protein